MALGLNVANRGCWPNGSPPYRLIPEADIRSQLNALASPVDKTASPREREAFALVCDYVDEWYRNGRGLKVEG